MADRVELAACSRDSPPAQLFLSDGAWVTFPEKELGEAWGRSVAEGPDGGSTEFSVDGNQEALGMASRVKGDKAAVSF